MITTDNATFNSLLDQLLPAESRKTMMVGSSLIIFDAGSIALQEKTLAMKKKEVASLEQAIMLSRLGMELKVTTLEI